MNRLAFKTSICKNYDPTHTKEYNNNKVAKGWTLEECGWTKKSLLKLTTSCGISGNDYNLGHKTKANWRGTHFLMLDFDNGAMTVEKLLKAQKSWNYNSYVYSSQNHQRKKIGKGSVEEAKDRLRALIPLKNPITDNDDFELLEFHILRTFNKDGQVAMIDETFMHKHRYFAHGTDEISSFISGKGFVEWENLPGIIESKKALEKKKSTKAKETRGRKKQLLSLNTTFRNHWEVLTRNNVKLPISQINTKTEIVCYICGNDPDRGNPGAINACISFNDNGQKIMYCSSCESRGKGVDGKGVYNMHPEDKFISDCLQRNFILFTDSKKSETIHGRYSWDARKAEKTWGYSKVSSRTFSKEILLSHGMDMPKYIPQFDFDMCFDVEHQFDFEHSFINKYTPTKYLITPVPATFTPKIPVYIGKVLNHVFSGDVDMIKHYVNDLADLIQTRKKRKTTFLIQGTEGTGKGLWFNRVIKEMIGPSYCSEMDQGPFLNNFNSVLEDNIMTLVNECNANFTRSSGFDGSVEKMKTAITDDRLSIERKGKDRYNGYNNTSFMFASNRLKAVVLSMDDRRFNVAPRQESKIERAAWWPKDGSIEDKMESELQSFVWFLKTYEVDKSKIGTVIDNDAKKVIQALSRTVAEEFFHAVNAGDYNWFSENIPRIPGERGESRYAEMKQFLYSISKDSKVTKQALLELYNCIVHLDKNPVNMHRFHQAAAGHIKKWSRLRIPGNSERPQGLLMDWKTGE